MRKVMPRELQIGHLIVTNAEEVLGAGKRPKLDKVLQLEHYACGNRHTHVNHSDCYMWSIGVWIA